MSVKNSDGFNWFTPLSKNGSKRLKIRCSMYEMHGIPRGRAHMGEVFEITAKNGKKYKAQVVACDLPTCFCDAQLV